MKQALRIISKPRRPRPGFTLLELLVVSAIAALLAAVLLSALNKARATARAVVCMNNLKTVSFEFSQFADPAIHPYRGDSERYGRNRFRLEDFQERLYGIDEFWKTDGRTHRYAPEEQPMMCPSAAERLESTRGLACSEYAVRPISHVSIGFNMRLLQVSRTVAGWPRLQNVRLTARIMEQPMVPLALDVEGGKADEQGVLPYYSAPPAGDTGFYASGRFWFPAKRHNGKVNAAFIGGHVRSSPAPAKEAGWKWSYQPPLN